MHDKNKAKEFLNWIEKYGEKMDKHQSNKMYQMLNELDLYLPMGREEQIELVLNEEKEVFLSILTSKSEYSNYTNEKVYKKVKFQEIKHIVIHVKSPILGIVINPFSNNIVLRKKDIETLDSLFTGMTLERTEGFLSGIELYVPDKINSKLKKDICEFSKNNKNILEIYLYNARRKTEDKYHYLFLIKFIGRDIDLFPRLAPIIQKNMCIGDKFELLQASKELDNLYGKDKTIIYSYKD